MSRFMVKSIRETVAPLYIDHKEFKSLSSQHFRRARQNPKRKDKLA